MTTVVLLHSHLAVAARLRDTLGAVRGLEVTGLAGSLAGLRECFAGGLPDVLLVDLLLPAVDVSSVLHGLRGNGHVGRPHLLALSMTSDDPRLMHALRHGVDGYHIQATHTVPALATAIEQVIKGESPMSPQIARQIKAHFDALAFDDTDRIGEPPHPPRLSETDALLLQWTAEGYLVGEVARGLQMSVHGVGVRMRNIYRKLQFDVRARAQAPLAA